MASQEAEGKHEQARGQGDPTRSTHQECTSASAVAAAAVEAAAATDDTDTCLAAAAELQLESTAPPPDAAVPSGDDAAGQAVAHELRRISRLL